jgi:hypothetical protein
VAHKFKVERIHRRERGQAVIAIVDVEAVHAGVPRFAPEDDEVTREHVPLV